ncbi:hypothetical protein GP2143_03243 [marine gamma proteobacterium HTCC2143]|uniref:Uncharacterized protein n=1 Tax=marine gamma proteobacterium HTCC2143 TaxID=247633 RepID=A0YD00_9GAMM|nr:hypothetical protein GP2143_03243 [marine gamma proteobacterium HTCC2143]
MELLAEEMLDGMDWDWIYRNWLGAVERFGFDPREDVFRKIEVFAPGSRGGRDRQITWWPVRDLQGVQIETQRRLVSLPNARYAAHTDYQQNKGTNDTAEQLVATSQEPELLAAILLSASLFTRCSSYRIQYPHENWPIYKAAKGLQRIIDEVLQEKGISLYWAPTCTDLLPEVSCDRDYKIEELTSLVRYLAEEHVASFASFRILIVDFLDRPTPFLKRAIEAEHERLAQEKIEQEAWQENLKREKKLRMQKEALEHAARKKQHPRCDQWAAITPMDLEKLVWSTPVSQLAKEFGVSGPAVKKKCKAMRVETPRPGFWRRVSSGKMPHPQGVSPNPCAAVLASQPKGNLSFVADHLDSQITKKE